MRSKKGYPPPSPLSLGQWLLIMVLLTAGLVFVLRTTDDPPLTPPAKVTNCK